MILEQQVKKVFSSKIAVLMLFFISSLNVTFAQKQQPKHKGSFFVHWGWNRAGYTKSNLSMKGDGYDLELKHIAANDKLTKPISYYNYLRPDRITIPQTNFRLGYFIKDNIAIELAIDHMKYVMNQNQVVHAKGVITKASPYAGTYDKDITLTEDFLTFEHTDGLNYVHVALEKFFTAYKSKNGKHWVEYSAGTDIGALVPKTNVKFLDYERTDRFHLSGAGIGIKGGIQGVFWKHLVVRVESKLGYIFMPNIIMHKTGIPGSAKQKFAFAQANWQIGYQFKL